MRGFTRLTAGGRFFGLILGLGVLAATPAPAAEDDLHSALRMMPADAAMAVVVPNLETLTHQVARFNDRLSLNQPQLTDVVREIQQMAGMTAGVRRDGPLLVVVSAEAGREGAAPPTLLLVPVEDYGAFVGNFGADPTEHVTEGRLRGGRRAYIRSVDRHAVMGADIDRVRQYRPGRQAAEYLRRAGTLAEPMLTSASLVALFDVEAARPALEAGLRAARQKLEAQVGDEGPATLTGRVYSRAAESLLSDTGLAALALGFDEGGLRVAGSARFRAGSNLAGLFAEGPETSTALDGVARRPWLSATGIETGAIDLARLLDAAIETMEEEGAWAGPLLEGLRPLAERAERVGTGYYVPEQGSIMGGGMLRGVTVVETGDGEALLGEIERSLEHLAETRIPLGVDAGDGEATVAFQTQYTPGVLRVDGIRVDQYQVQPVLPPRLMQQLGPLSIMMGGMGQAGYVAALDGRVVMTTATDAQLIRIGLEAAAGEAEGIGGEARVLQARESVLPPHLVAESYLDVGGMASLVNQAISLFGGGGVEALTIPANMPPVSLGIGSRDRAWVVHGHVPTEVMRFVSDGVKHFAPLLAPAGGAAAPDGAPTARRR